MIKLDKWQEEVLKYEGDLLLCTGRRVGKTYILARKAIDFMAQHPGVPVVIVSLTEDQAMIIMSMALNYAKEKYPGLIGKKKDKPQLRSLVLNGGKMIVRPVGNTGDGARGFEGGILIVDEASRVPKMFWIAAKPILLTTNGKIWMGSTPFGKKGYFWDRYNEVVNKNAPDARFKVFSISTEEAVRDREISTSWTAEQKAGALRILEEDKREMTWREYAQEYMGQFVDGLSNFFPEDLVNACCFLKRPDGINQSLKAYMGCDIARMGGDEGTFEIFLKSDKIRQVENIVTIRKLTYETENKIIELARIYPFHKESIGIDSGAGTLGVSVMDHLLLQSSIKYKVVALNNRSRSLDPAEKSKVKLQKEDFYNNLLSLMQQGKIELLDDDDIKLSLRSVIYEVVEAEDEISKTKITSSYGHIAEGIVRGAYLAEKDKHLKIWAA